MLLTLALLIISTCLNKDICHRDFKESLHFLKGYVADNTTTFYTPEIEKNIKFLEPISGIFIGDQGGALSKSIVTEKDIPH
ncbi:hypothetical protein [uncultured Winogradskyella sp.]|uniref:hypothetical protein n=1 Tax=uncultured Winogradskyella sp. TaxID=395353 RepID=UPI0030DCF7C3|tara:strand:- start:74 stop:316 length:243 start_codon:yes stop_codon:yes gene_type:complete